MSEQQERRLSFLLAYRLRESNIAHGYMNFNFFFCFILAVKVMGSSDSFLFFYLQLRSTRRRSKGWMNVCCNILTPLLEPSFLKLSYKAASLKELLRPSGTRNVLTKTTKRASDFPGYKTGTTPVTFRLSPHIGKGKSENPEMLPLSLNHSRRRGEPLPWSGPA